MNVAELRKYHNVENNSQLAKKIKRGRSTIAGWEKEGIPLSTQAMLQIQTQGKLKADLQSLTA